MIIQEKIHSQIQQATNILLVSHINPDGDTLGANSAFYYYLNKLDKQVDLFCLNEIPTNLEFLIDKKLFIHEMNFKDLQKYDLIICNDCGDIKRTGIETLLKNKPQKTITINIDHHYTNDNFADINLVEPQASSTSEIVFNLFKINKVAMDKQMTNSLLTGILTDTTYFANAATTIKAVQSASELLNQGASIKQITQNIWRNKNINTLKLWGKIFNQLIFNHEYKTATAIITQEDLQGYLVEDTEGIANFLTNLYDAKIILVLTQTQENKIKGNLRTTHDDVDVSKIAQLFGGGGHQKAAGFQISGRLKKEDNSWRIE